MVILIFTGTAAVLEAYPYTYLQPPSIAVSDFEVSMRVPDKEESKVHYGQLVSETVLTALVRENASEIVTIPAEESRVRGDWDLASRTYLPPFFKIYDKKQSVQFDLDYVALGNVYEIVRSEDTVKAAIGINVRVLNAKSSEESYSYATTVNRDLSNLSQKCTEMARSIIRDLMEKRCAQFMIIDATEHKAKYRLFWQSKEVENYGATVCASDDTSKRDVKTGQFYRVLPGDFSISIYNCETQSVRILPFSLSAGDVQHITLEKQYLDPQLGSITVDGLVKDGNSYKFVLADRQRRDSGAIKIPSFTVTVASGELPVVTVDGDSASNQPANSRIEATLNEEMSELTIKNVIPSIYDLNAFSQPASVADEFGGWWRVSTQNLRRSTNSVSLDLLTKSDARIHLADLGLQDRKTTGKSRHMLVTFLMNPGFGYSARLRINDGENVDELWWSDREKVTVESECSLDNWNSDSSVSYEFHIDSKIRGVPDANISKTVDKVDLDPGEDAVIVIGIDGQPRRESLAQEKIVVPTAENPQPQQSGNEEQTPKTQTPQSSLATQSGPKEPSKLLLGGFFEAGVGGLLYFTNGVWAYGSPSSTYGVDLGLSGSVFYYFLPSFGLGIGVIAHAQLTSIQATGLEISAGAIIGDLSKQNLALILEAGYGGLSFTAEVGILLMRSDKRGGLTFWVGSNYETVPGYDETIIGTNSSLSATSLFLGIGYLFGI